jgi:hypothetical protein
MSFEVFCRRLKLWNRFWEGVRSILTYLQVFLMVFEMNLNLHHLYYDGSKLNFPKAILTKNNMLTETVVLVGLTNGFICLLFPSRV